MKLLHILRVLTPIVGLIYTCIAFRNGVRHRTIWMDVDCLIAALYFFAGAKSHSTVKSERRHRRFD
jgi:hypothetical protein